MVNGSSGNQRSALEEDVGRGTEMTGWNRDYKNGYPQQAESGIPGQPGVLMGRIVGWCGKIRDNR